MDSNTSESGISLFRTPRGFERLTFLDQYEELFSLQQSSAIGDDVIDGPSAPGSSFLWVNVSGSMAHLPKDAVKIVVDRMQRWLNTGSMLLEGEELPRSKSAEELPWP